MRDRLRRRGAALLVVGIALLVPAGAARADTTVNDLTGLRAAVAAAAADPTADTTITLSADTIDLAADGGGPIVWPGPGTLTIAGDPTRHPALDAGGLSRVAEVDGGTLALNGLTVSGGHAAGDGGGVLVNGGDLVATASTFTRNVAAGGGGGAVAFGVALGTAELTDSTISGNGATGAAGGGGIDVGAGSATLTDDTIASNAAPAGTAGGVAGQPTMANTIVTQNTPSDCATPLVTEDHDVFGDGTCAVGGTPVDAGLGPLADNGGPTPTHALAATSPAVDAARNGACLAPGQTTLAPDQTGLARSDGQCDIGAYEYAPPSAVTEMAPDAPTQTTADVAGVVGGGHRQSYRFDYGLTDAYGAQTPPQPVTGPDVGATLAGLSPATTYHYRLVVDGSDGEAPGQDQTFTTAAAPPQVVTQTQTVTVTVPVRPPVIEAILLPPTLSNLRLTPRPIIPMVFGGSVARAHGARVTYTAMNSVLATFTVDRVVTGLRRGSSCARRPARSRGKTCERFVRVPGTFTHDDVQGANAFRFTGGLKGRRLPPGRYRLNARPRDLTGRYGPWIRATFSVVR